MTLTLCLLFLAVSVLVPGEAAELRSTSVEHELSLLREIFDKALANYDLVYASLTENCADACPDGECADGCLFKLLQQYEERLRALQTVILKLEKLACKECPGTFLTTMPVAELGAAASGSSTNPLGPPVEGRVATHDMSDSFETILVASDGHLYRETLENTIDLDGLSRSVTYDPYKSRLYTVEKHPLDQSVSIVARNVGTGDRIGSFEIKYTEPMKPVDIAMFGPSQIAVLATNGVSSKIDLINIANVNAITSLPTINGVARRIATDNNNGKLFFTSDKGIVEYDVNSGPKTISAMTGAVGIDYYGDSVFFCDGSTGMISWINTLTGESQNEMKNYGGCSDMSVKGLRPAASPLATPTVHLVVASNTDYKVIDFIQGQPEGNTIVDFPEPLSSERSTITFVPKSTTGTVNLG